MLSMKDLSCLKLLGNIKLDASLPCHLADVISWFFLMCSEVVITSLAFSLD